MSACGFAVAVALGSCASRDTGAVPASPRSDAPTDPQTETQLARPGAQSSGATPMQPTTPPAADGSPTKVPNDHRREPEAQRNAPPDIDRTRGSTTP